ncbi:MAG: ABC transporter substrate-binding protein [Acidobacteriota bacterium]
MKRLLTIRPCNQFIKRSVLLLFLFLSIFSYSFSDHNSIIYLKSIDIETLDPGETTDSYSTEVIFNIYEGLVRFVKNSTKIEGCLAKSWIVKDNGKRWIFKLRKDVKFHNGEDFNAKAVEINFKTRLKNKDKYQNWNLAYAYLDHVRAIDEFTVEFILKIPYIPFLYSLANAKSMIVAPSSYTGRIFKPVGTGPFIYSEWRKDKYVTIVRNTVYWDSVPKISKVVFKIVKDAAWRFLQMKTGKAELAFVKSGHEYEEIRGHREIKIISVPSITIHSLGFNIRKKPFNDIRVRQAFSHMINKEKLIKHVFQNFAGDASTPLPPHIFGFNDRIKNYRFDIKKAGKLLREAGYEKGFKVSLYYSINSSNLKTIAIAFKRAAKKLKINIIMKPLPFDELRAAINKGIHDMVMIGWAGDIPDPDVFLYNTFTLKKGHLNRTGYNNPELTKIIDKARSTVDMDKRKSLYFKAQEIIYRDIPLIPLFNLNDLFIYNKKVKNVYVNRLSILIFKDMYLEDN